MKALEELNKLIENKTRNEINSYSEEYLESKWYREPTLEDVFGDTISSDVKRLKNALEKGLDTHSLLKEFEDAATEYGKSWFDEDLGYERTGYEYETKIYTALRNIVAEKEGLALTNWRDYYEGRGFKG